MLVKRLYTPVRAVPVLQDGRAASWGVPGPEVVAGRWDVVGEGGEHVKALLGACLVLHHVPLPHVVDVAVHPGDVTA